MFEHCEDPYERIHRLEFDNAVMAEYLEETARQLKEQSRLVAQISEQLKHHAGAITKMYELILIMDKQLDEERKRNK